MHSFTFVGVFVEKAKDQTFFVYLLRGSLNIIVRVQQLMCRSSIADH